jgi:hypothetical protein
MATSSTAVEPLSGEVLPDARAQNYGNIIHAQLLDFPAKGDRIVSRSGVPYKERTTVKSVAHRSRRSQRIVRASGNGCGGFDRLDWDDDIGLESAALVLPSSADDAEAAARFASQFIMPDLTILDAIGRPQVLAWLKPARIVPFDAELCSNKDAHVHPADMPENREAQLAVAFGLPEWPSDLALPLQRLMACGLPILCSCRPQTKGGASDEQRFAAFEAFFAEERFSIAWRYVDKGSAIYLMLPPGCDMASVSTVGYRAAGDLVTVLKGQRPALLVAGFFGRGNCGDEALFQVIYEQFSPEFDIIVSLDEHGATEGYWNWYPYNLCRRIHQGNLADPARSCVGMIVGGGGLPVGFVADQVFAARSAGVPIALAGTDFPGGSIHHGKSTDVASLEYLKCFDVVALRSARAVERAARLGHPAAHGADWALRLLSDENEAVQRVTNRAFIVLREFPLSVITFKYVQEITRLISQLRATGFALTLLPFCAEDDRFATALGLDLIAPTERHWWNPRRVKQLIAMSGLVISVGRLHPTIFAASSRTAVLQLCPPLADDVDPGAFSKIAAMAQEFDLDYHPTVDSVCEHLRLGRIRPSGTAALASSQQRLDTMIGGLRTLFRQGPQAVGEVIT